MSIVDSAVYRNGRRIPSPSTLTGVLQVHDQVAAPDEDVLTWIGLYRPTEEELSSLAERFDLHELAVEDTVTAHQRPKCERYGSTLFTVLRPVSYEDESEQVHFGELHVFTGPDFVITIRHAETGGVSEVRDRLETEPERLARGPEAVLYALVDRVMDDYYPVIDSIETDVDEIEEDLFSGRTGVSTRIYALARQVAALHRGVASLQRMTDTQTTAFGAWRHDEELRHELRDIHDHALQVTARTEAFRSSLMDAMQLDSTMTAARQNDAAMELNQQTKRISSWAAILFAPSIVGATYGMNFEHMPELSWAFGYPFALGLMLAIAVGLYIVFKRKDWI